MRASLETIPAGFPGLQAKLRRIRQLVDRSKADMGVRRIALSVVHDVAPRDEVGEVTAATAWVRERFPFRRDPHGLELFVDPRITLATAARGGVPLGTDCDDATLALSALLESLGYPTRYRVGGRSADVPSHIWLEVRTRSRGWLPIETTRPLPVGTDPSGRFPWRATFGDDGALGELEGFKLRRLGKKIKKNLPTPVKKVLAEAQRFASKGPLQSLAVGWLAAPLAAPLLPATARALANPFTAGALAARKPLVAARGQAIVLAAIGAPIAAAVSLPLAASIAAGGAALSHKNPLKGLATAVPGIAESFAPGTGGIAKLLGFGGGGGGSSAPSYAAGGAGGYLPTPAYEAYPSDGAAAGLGSLVAVLALAYLLARR